MENVLPIKQSEPMLCRAVPTASAMTTRGASAAISSTTRKEEGVSNDRSFGGRRGGEGEKEAERTFEERIQHTAGESYNFFPLWTLITLVRGLLSS